MRYHIISLYLNNIDIDETEWDLAVDIEPAILPTVVGWNSLQIGKWATKKKEFAICKNNRGIVNQRRI